MSRRPPSLADRQSRPAAARPRDGRRPTAAPALPGPERLLFGLHAVRAALLNPKRVCHRLLVTAAGAEEMADTLAEAQAAGLRRPQPETVERATLDAALPDGATHQGIVLVVDPLSEPALEPLLAGLAADAPAVVVVLDQVTDPHNVGAILRSASAFGATAVLMTDRNAPPATATLAKIACGALEHVPLVRLGNLARALKLLQEAGFWCYGLDEHAPEVLGAGALPARTALLLGAEGTGLRRLTRELCDALVRLPTGGPVASLNVSNAAAVALYETVRQAGAPTG